MLPIILYTKVKWYRRTTIALLILRLPKAICFGLGKETI